MELFFRFKLLFQNFSSTLQKKMERSIEREKWNKLSTWQIILPANVLCCDIVSHDSHRLCWLFSLSRPSERIDEGKVGAAGERKKRIQQFEINRKSEKCRDEKLEEIPTKKSASKKKRREESYSISLIRSASLSSFSSVKMGNRKFTVNFVLAGEKREKSDEKLIFLSFFCSNDINGR